MNACITQMALSVQYRGVWYQPTAPDDPSRLSCTVYSNTPARPRKIESNANNKRLAWRLPISVEGHVTSCRLRAAFLLPRAINRLSSRACRACRCRPKDLEQIIRPLPSIIYDPASTTER